MDKPISNFHTHTQLCNHASGMPQDYVLEAQKAGCSMLGFSDHCPYPPNMYDNWQGSRMFLEQLGLYKDSVMEAKSLAPFPVYFGFECEYDAQWKSWYTDELKGKWGAQYLVFGPHWVKTGNNHVYIPTIQRDKNLLHKYTDQTVEGIASGMYAFLAHPDLFMTGWTEWDEEAVACSKAIIDAAVDCNLPLEINGLGLHRGLRDTSKGKRYNYPYDEFWQLVAQKGDKAKIICNSDSHESAHVIQNARNAREYADKFGFDVSESIFTI
ncbi:MAG: histidinol-phosphatase [Treponema sp.]|nr:histidinol-phosphatase [Treponema sp.]